MIVEYMCFVYLPGALNVVPSAIPPFDPLYRNDLFFLRALLTDSPVGNDTDGVGNSSSLLAKPGLGIST